ncbi:hypothetical protein D3C76_1323690 [compost metagenome]
MGDGAEQLAAFAEVAADAFTHAVEGAAHFHHFAAAGLGQRLHLGAQGHFPRSRGQALQRPALPVHQQADEQQQEAAGEDDEPQLLGGQALVLQAGIGLGHQRGEVQPFARADLDLRHQHRGIHRLQGQRVMGPGTRQFVELEAAVEDAQLVRADEVQRHVHLLAQALAQHRVHLVQHRALARRFRQHTHLQRLVVEGDEEARAAHAA